MIKQMWSNGPLRQWSDKPTSSWSPYDGVGYVGPYVCSECRRDVVGVYRHHDGWKCGRQACNRAIEEAS